MRMQNYDRDFERLIDGLRLKLTKAAFHLCGEKEAALDIVQDTIIDAYKNFSSLKDMSKASGWIYAILRRKAYLYYNSKKDEAALTEEIADSNDISASVIRQIYIDQLARLDDKDHEILAGKYMMGLSYKELAESLGIKEGTLRVRCLRAKERLREILGSVAKNSGSTAHR